MARSQQRNTKGGQSNIASPPGGDAGTPRKSRPVEKATATTTAKGKLSKSRASNAKEKLAEARRVADENTKAMQLRKDEEGKKQRQKEEAAAAQEAAKRQAWLAAKAKFSLGHASLAPIAATQDDIGWDNFVCGQIARLMRVHMELHLRTAPTRMVAKSWCCGLATRLLELVHTQWTVRNDSFVHAITEDGAKREELHQLRDSITAEFLEGSDSLLPEFRHLLDETFESVWDKSVSDRRQWLIEVAAARELPSGCTSMISPAPLATPFVTNWTYRSKSSTQIVTPRCPATSHHSSLVPAARIAATIRLNVLKSNLSFPGSVDPLYYIVV